MRKLQLTPIPPTSSLILTFCIASIFSLIGCSPAEPISVYTDEAKIPLILLKIRNSNLFVHYIAGVHKKRFGRKRFFNQLKVSFVIKEDN